MLPAMAGCVAKTGSGTGHNAIDGHLAQSEILSVLGTYGQRWLTSHGTLGMVFCYAACMRQLLLPALTGCIVECSIKEFDD